jgi:hypothetical protein
MLARSNGRDVRRREPNKNPRRAGRFEVQTPIIPAGGAATSPANDDSLAGRNRSTLQTKNGRRRFSLAGRANAVGRKTRRDH